MWWSTWSFHQTHTDARGSVQPEVYPRPPQGFYTGDGFGVEVPLDAPLSSPAVDVADVGRQELFVQKLLG